MLTKTLYSVCSLLLTLSILSCSAGSSESNPALFRYDTELGTVYLFPTVHSLPDDAASAVDAASDLLPQKVIDTISNSDKLLTEVDPTEATTEDAQEETKQLALATDHENDRRSLFEYAREGWDDDEYAKLEELFEGFHESPFVEPQFDRYVHERIRPHQFYFDVLNVTTDLAVENELSIDAAVTRVAHEESVDQFGLGDILLLNRLADDAPQSMYLDVIKEVAREEPTIEDLIENQAEAISRSFRKWKNGKLPVVTTHEDGNEMDSADENVHQLSISSVDAAQQEERAEVWMSTILEALESDDVEQVFVAVGMNHLAEVPDEVEIEHIRSRLATEFHEERVE